MHWLALLLSPPTSCDEQQGCAAAPDQTQQALAWWALQFSPKVARLEDAVVLEVHACLRLFRGADALHARVRDGAASSGLALQALAWAPTSLAALALARAAVSDGLSRPITQILDGLPLHCLSAVQAHAPMLARLGCRTLGDVRRLPRAGLSRRFGKAPLQALDQALGLLPEAHAWLQAPAEFEARLELPQRVENAQLLLQFVRQLLLQLCAWLAARHAGIQELTLHWDHDAMRARDAGSGGALSIRTSCCTRDFGHLSRLLAEHLAQLTLAAPAGEIRLQAGEVLAMEELSASLLPAAPDQAHEPLTQLLERISTRLGPERVRCGHLLADHRLEAMQHWQAWADSGTAPKMSQPPRGPATAQPTWLLSPPLRLAVYQDRPQYQQAPLQLLAGPQRIEGGWWQLSAALPNGHAQVQRDYFLALSAGHLVLWVFQQRLSEFEHGWFLHGVFA
ncbi:Y-family DNA polymerase [Roseateles oligotrophus]|uniref:DNA polymerase Y family protein n=1 Tax=Roseateles oligotrophus TaxID=1769250 RepID=A0ABT2Y8M6_9BURK|nr:DNA polymerase Y family protein [Roseateles oligotrophus]MCV2366631.1 DNA polymerase Y family protein [Roseateles oligotrophus]